LNLKSINVVEEKSAMQKHLCVVSALFVLAGCAAVPSGQSKRDQVASRVVAPPPGYLDVERFSQERLALYAASQWVKQAPTEDERFSRGMRVFADLRQDYYQRLNAGLPAVETKNLLAAKVSERVQRDYLPAGTQGLALLFRDAAYPVNNANYSYPSGRLELPIGGGSYSYKIPDADAVLNATTSRAKPMYQNLLAISDDMKYEGERVRSHIVIDTPRAWINYAIPQEQFATSLYENRKKGMEMVLKTSGYVLFKLAKCENDKNFDRLACSFELVSNNVESPTLVAQRIPR
jgi:hypothetical protein